MRSSVENEKPFELPVLPGLGDQHPRLGLLGQATLPCGVGVLVRLDEEVIAVAGRRRRKPSRSTERALKISRIGGIVPRW